jgi:hypothetical protein
MRILPFLSIILTVTFRLQGQPTVGSWTDRLSYNTAVSLAAGNKKIFASTGTSLIMYEKELSELEKISRTEGLSETGISDIALSGDQNTLVIAYASTNVDLLTGRTIFNIPDIRNSYVAGRKAINRIRTNGKFACLASSFGIVVIDLARKEVNDTWKPGSGPENNEVWDLCFGDGKIFAATETGIYYALSDKQGLSYFGNWTRLNSLPDPEGRYTAIIYSGNRLFANKSDAAAAGDSIFITGSSTVLLSFIPGTYNRSIDPGSNGFTVSSGSSLRYFSPEGVLVRTISSYGFATPDAMQSVYDNGDIWIADAGSGLVKGVNMSQFSRMVLPGPASNKVFHIASYNGQTVICAGGTDKNWNDMGRLFEVSRFLENSWVVLPGSGMTDPVRALIDRNDENHLFVATWGDGLVEFKGTNLTKRYDESNSPLQSMIPGQSQVRIGGLAMDKDRNLWITQSGVQESIRVLTPAGKWIANPVSTGSPVTGDLIITVTGMKWIILPAGYGLFILDDNNTPDIFGDDKYKKLTVKDNEDKVILTVLSIAEDLEGNIWIGTEQGPLVYYNPLNVFEEDLKAQHIKVPRNDGSGLADYLLNTETVTSVVVDGSDRKWLGTSGSGAYYVSPDGINQLKHFTTLNSPLLSDSIITMSVDNRTGEVWFGTPNGTQSYRGNATEGSGTFSKVYAFPNPVREDFTGNLTVTGLMKDTKVKITDISGNLVYETVSDGGQATWDLRTYNGRRVSTGVYLIFCSSSDGSESCVTKVLVIR